VPEESRRILLEQTLWGAKIDASCWKQSVTWIKHSEGATYMLVHVLGNVGDIKIGVALVGELLELGVEGFLEKKVSGRYGGGSDSDVPEVMEAADAVLGILKVVVLDEPEPTMVVSE
jgi:hypothetical protein